LGKTSKASDRPDHTVRIVEIRCTPHRNRNGGKPKGPTAPNSDGVLRIATNLLDVPAEVIALIYSYRWTMKRGAGSLLGSFLSVRFPLSCPLGAFGGDASSLAKRSAIRRVGLTGAKLRLLIGDLSYSYNHDKAGRDSEAFWEFCEHLEYAQSEPATGIWASCGNRRQPTNRNG
jgi:hypothetical protein